MELTQTTRAWLAVLRQRLAEVEEDTPEAFANRRELVRMLVASVTIEGESARTARVRVRYRFGPPPDENHQTDLATEDSVAPPVRDTSESLTASTTATAVPVLTVLAAR